MTILLRTAPDDRERRRGCLDRIGLRDRPVHPRRHGLAGHQVPERTGNERVGRPADPNGGRASAPETCAQAEKVFTDSNRRILEHAAKNPDDWGMGCTADLLAFTDGRYVIGHVGDSRVYLLRNTGLSQLTRDHSWVQLQVDQGVLTPPEARIHPRKNIILRAVGTDVSVSPDILEGEALDHDIFLLCSDGLTDMVEDSLIQRILSSAAPLHQKADGLIEAALAAGGSDNVTVVLCQVEMSNH